MITNLSEYGNTSAGSIPLALDEAVRSGKVGEDETREGVANVHAKGRLVYRSLFFLALCVAREPIRDLVGASDLFEL